MRGHRETQQSIFVAFNVEECVPDDHPLREIKRRCDRVLAAMSRDFDKAYGTTGRVGLQPRIAAQGAAAAGAVRDLLGAPPVRGLRVQRALPLVHRLADRTPETFNMNRDRFERHGFDRRFIEPVIGWCKHVGGLARTRFIGHERIQDDAMMTAAAWNLMRMTRLRGAT